MTARTLKPRRLSTWALISDLYAQVLLSMLHQIVDLCTNHYPKPFQESHEAKAPSSFINASEPIPDQLK